MANFNERMILEIIKSVLERDNVSIDSGLGKVTGWDSVAHVKILLLVEEKTGVSIPPDQFGTLLSVRDILNFLETTKNDDGLKR